MHQIAEISKAFSFILNEAISFDESGKIKKEMTFIAGQKEGKEISYNEDGSIEKEEKYRSGKVIN